MLWKDNLSSTKKELGGIDPTEEHNQMLDDVDIPTDEEKTNNQKQAEKKNNSDKKKKSSERKNKQKNGQNKDGSNAGQGQ